MRILHTSTLWSSLGDWLMGAVVPHCGTTTAQSSEHNRRSRDSSHGTADVLGPNVVCSIFGCRKGNMSLCIQKNVKEPPLLLLEFSMPTSVLLKEMSSESLQILLQCVRPPVAAGQMSQSIFSEPVWSMCCNGAEVGVAVKREASRADQKLLRLIRKVSVGLVVIPGKTGTSKDEDTICMRAIYERVVNSADSESYHMISPQDGPRQELSLFLLRS
ncbi:hypothetical protein O6H91_17G002700 [Diphasiastrum complanatum]|uniref:Uncharacterized protein n=2 Tax=Diphasiastrum complanatum TaxID=34168 RepID=A0ACC2B3S0_DIPCM|nr:hypothetical protein O6H91_17G002500 [Diphasiastrum complanatum]KAJ7524382.1 hypothetical protein O6H91_17G002700 [Diphasiastrum complanatum]